MSLDNIDFNLTNYDFNDDLYFSNNLIVYLHNPSIDCEIPNIIWNEASSQELNQVSSNELSQELSEILDNKSEFSQTSDIDDDIYNSDGSSYSIDIN